MNNQVLATRIREVRESRGFTQEQFAEVLGISRQAYMRLEQGKRSISFVEIEKLATFLNEHYSIFTEIDDVKIMSLTALCRDEYGAETESSFQKIEQVLNVFSAQERLYYQMKEVE